ncbi:MFS family permease [Salirhabdus euzebyi]|uniref:MFS family permease n=1 Tax=Salirhabdus euzebyi TaxID=394506 RepID=A0A841Q8J9_9BACI|nr:MFS transporter [Salirhabdus euzebyi]MBB6454730.1 MFS family permease [Salirhabdus euzebyi]
MIKNVKVTSTILIIAGIFIASNLYTMLPVQTFLTEKFSISLQLSSLASFCFIISYAFGLLCFGIGTDLFNERTILLIGMLILSIVTYSISFVNDYGVFLFSRSIQGFFAASFAPAAFSYIFKYFQGKTQTMSIALINTGFLFAGIFGQIIAAYFVFSHSFQTLFYAFSGFYFICFVLLYLTLAKEEKTTTASTNLLRYIVTLIRYSPLQKLYITAFFLLFTVMLFYGGFELYLVKNGESFPFSLQVFRIIGLIGIVPAFFASRLEAKYGAKDVLLYSLILMTIGFIFPLITLNEWTLIFSSIFMIASTSLTIPMVILLVGKCAASAKGRAISVYSFMLLTGASIGSVLAAFIPFHFILLGIAILFIGLVYIVKMLKVNNSYG